MIRKGRQRKQHGENHTWAKLTAAQVMEIRRMYRPYIVTARMLAKMFGVGITCINSIVTGKKWKHLPDVKGLKPREYLNSATNPNAAFSIQQVLEIRNIGSSMPRKELAKKFKTTVTNIRSILIRKTWKDI